MVFYSYFANVICRADVIKKLLEKYRTYWVGTNSFAFDICLLRVFVATVSSSYSPFAQLNCACIISCVKLDDENL